MIYISTSCVKSETIKESVLKLVESGFRNIELSGGTKYYSNLESELLQLKEEYKLNFLLHNYFPPPKSNFVLNLASLDDKIYYESIEHYKRALDLSFKLGCPRYGLHAGFLVDPKVNELGIGISEQSFYSRSKSMSRFVAAFKELDTYASGVQLYIENNVFSKKNKDVFGDNPFFLTDFDGYVELKDNLAYSLLLDVAHLKVSCKSLSKSFSDEFAKLIGLSDYIHVSDNDGLVDSNNALSSTSSMYGLLSSVDLRGKTITLEVYETLENIVNSYNLLLEEL